MALGLQLAAGFLQPELFGEQLLFFRFFPALLFVVLPLSLPPQPVRFHLLCGRYRFAPADLPQEPSNFILGNIQAFGNGLNRLPGDRAALAPLSDAGPTDR